MTAEQFEIHIETVGISRKSRDTAAALILENPQLIGKSLELIANNDASLSGKVGYALELVMRANIALLLPYLELFTETLPQVKLDAATRPMAKICDLLCEAHFKKRILLLPKEHQEKILETCFDWLITDQKVAVKVYAMQALFYLRKDYEWITPELKRILEQDFNVESAAFRARAKRLLGKM